ncbi:hypothetical protein QMT40_001792 [Parvibaculaceae bacterium PLY_AMNH_Bact1]|nr:hypothetical protein QMT40_001792 [Parvibaculaceae bacterium PLY_AMNH_Bact1]
MKLSRELIPRDREGSIEFYREFLTAAAKTSPEKLKKAKRWLARNDLFFLLTVVCKRKDLNHPWLFDRCREVEHAPNGFLDAWAREHYKSTIITFGLTLQDILASHGDDPEPRYNGREVTVGIFSLNQKLARQFLRQIQYECENNEELKELFPEILWDYPKTHAPIWSVSEGLVFKRKGNPKEATVEANGLVDGMPTSKHYTHRIYDDVVTDKSVTSPEMIKKTTAAWELSDNLGTEGGVFRIIGTYYAMFDTYRVMKDRGIPVREHPCTSDGSEDFSKAVLRSPDELAKKRRLQGPYIFGCQMLLNPTNDNAQGFKEEWLKYWPAVNYSGLNKYIVVDPASSKKKTSDYTVMWVIGVAADKNYYLLDGVRDRLNLAQRTRTLFALHDRWEPLAVGYEQYGAQADIEHMELEMERMNYRFTITPLGGALKKEDRIRKLVPVFEAGRIYLPEAGIVKTDYEGKTVDVVRQFVQEEYLTFPVVTHDDGLDDLARILDEELGVVFPKQSADDKPKWQRDLEMEQGQASSWMTA